MSLSLRTVLPTGFPLASLSSLPRCASPLCPRPATLWQRWWARNEGIWLQQAWYCSPDCFQAGLLRRLVDTVSFRQPLAPQPRYLPLGLVLLSQGEISAEQLRRALQLQADTRAGKIGEWLVRIRAISEEQVTRALGMQQRCPVFAEQELKVIPQEMQWPGPLATGYRAVPIFHNTIQESLYVGFLEQVNHSFLFALERMLHCRTRPCIVTASAYQRRVQELEFLGRTEVITIRQRQSVREMTETVANYAQQVLAERCLMTVCGNQLWIRLTSTYKQLLDFLFALPASN